MSIQSATFSASSSIDTARAKRPGLVLAVVLLATFVINLDSYEPWQINGLGVRGWIAGPM